MTKKLVTKLAEEGYKIIVRIEDRQFGVAKVDEPDDGTDFDIYELSDKETLEPLVKGQLYSLSNLPTKKAKKDA